MLYVSAGVFRAFKMPGRKASSKTVTRRENTTAAQNEVEIKLSVFFSFFAPIAWEIKMDMPFVAPIATEVKSRMRGVEFVKAA